MNDHLPFSWLDPHRLSDYALEPSDLYPLMQTLADDLRRQILALEQSLAQSADAHAVHLILHALKGMAGMFAQPSLHQALTEADDVCRQGNLLLGLPLARSLDPALKAWQAEVLAWLQRYS